MAGDRTFRAVRQTTTPRPTLKPVSTQSPGGNRKAKSGGGVSGPPLPLLAAGAFTIVCAIATHQATPPPPPPEETSPFVLLVGPLLCGAAVFLKGMMSPTKPDAKKAAVETPIAPEAVKAEPAAAVVTSWYDAGMRLVDEAAEEEVALKGVVVPMEAVKEEKTVDAGGRRCRRRTTRWRSQRTWRRRSTRRECRGEGARRLEDSRRTRASPAES